MTAAKEMIKYKHMKEALDIEISEFGKSFFHPSEMGTIDRIVAALKEQRDLYAKREEDFRKIASTQ